MKGWTENGRSSLPPWAKEQGLWFALVRDCRIWRQEDSIHSTWATAPIPSFSAGISNQTQARSCKKKLYIAHILPIQFHYPLETALINHTSVLAENMSICNTYTTAPKAYTLQASLFDHAFFFSSGTPISHFQSAITSRSIQAGSQPIRMEASEINA